MSSLRGVGYSLEAAIADIIDNSIAADASRIEIGLDWNDGEPVVTILDDGCGMAEGQLVEAMRFGGRGAHFERTAADLGRFGLGLKTASLSQCRQLTVASSRGGSPAAFAWDVDVILKGDGGWHLLEGAMNVPRGTLATLRSQAHGTVVVWRKVDFGRLNDRPDSAALLAEIARLDRHLGMVFHRFLRGDARKIEILINGSAVEGWDPFLEHHEATIQLPTQRLKSPGGIVTVRGYVLPHRDQFRTEAEFEHAGGLEGWNAQQGFYVYRQRRLLSAGSWLGLGGSRIWTREEPSRLARIRIDIPNTADQDWRIDIRKAIARPPDAIRKRLQSIADDVRRRAREVFVHRGVFGRRVKGTEVSRIWHVNDHRAARRYTIRRDHELIQFLKERLGQSSGLLDAVLDLIERTVPVERVWLDVTERGTPIEPDDENTELLAAAATLVELLRNAGVPFEAAVAKVAVMDPFDKVPDLPKKLTKVTRGAN
jgi:hypothetical protein